MKLEFPNQLFQKLVREARKQNKSVEDLIIELLANKYGNQNSHN